MIWYWEGVLHYMSLLVNMVMACVGHVVTVFGYSTKGNDRYIKVWDSALNNGNGLEKTWDFDKGIISTLSGKSYYWEGTLYKKK